MLKRLEMPMTAAGKHLFLSDDLQKEAWVLYRETENGLIFTDFYNPEFSDEQYADDIVAVPLTSTFLNIVFLRNGTAVWNVIGSSGDIYYGPLDPRDVNNKNQWKHNGNWSNK